MRKLGIAGTAKNTGKTTTLNVLLEQVHTVQGPKKVALTSIGYDGEALDNVTGMPKPRIHVRPGMFVATAAQCVKTGDAGLRVLEDTQVETPLGRLLFCEVETPGRIVLAGPSSQQSLTRTLEVMQTRGMGLAIVDGALSRIAPFSLMDGILLATGAARTTDLARLGKETGSILSLLAAKAFAPVGRVRRLPSILHKKALDGLLASFQDADTICIDGVIAAQPFFSLPSYAQALSKKRLLLPDPTKLLLIGDAGEVCECLQTLRALDVTLGVCKTLSALAVTLNPYYPLYRYSKKEYAAAYVDKHALYNNVSAAAAPTPCFDVMDGGAPALVSAMEAWLQTPVAYA